MVPPGPAGVSPGMPGQPTNGPPKPWPEGISSFFLCVSYSDVIKLTRVFLCSRAHGERRRSFQRSSEDDPSSAHGPTLSRSSVSASRCLPGDATSDPVPGTARPASAHDDEAEPHHPHPETSRAGSCRGPPGERIQVQPAG